MVERHRATAQHNVRLAARPSAEQTPRRGQPAGNVHTHTTRRLGAIDTRYLVQQENGLLKALLIALLEPRQLLRQVEADGDYTSRLALLEETKMLPHGIIWEEYCRRNNVPSGREWLASVKQYEKKVLSQR